MAKNTLDRLARRVLLALASNVRHRVTLPHRLTQHLHFKGVVEVFVRNDVSFRMQSYGAAIENRLFWYGKTGYEPETFLPWLEAAHSAKVILDIGANTGLFSLGAGAMNPTANIFAFEALPRIADLARHNAQLNPSFNIRVVEAAVCDTAGEVVLHDPGGSQPPSASLKSDFVPGEKVTVTVKALRIDDFVEQNGLDRVDLVKLDVEGIEELALRGMHDTVRKFRPDIFLEVVDDRAELIAEIRSLVDCGYQAANLQADGIRPMNADSLTPEHRNLLLTTRPENFGFGRMRVNEG